MTAIAERLEITEPGVYDGIPDEIYHADPVPEGSLSSSGARMLLPPSCPAKYRWAQDHPEPPNRDFDLGKAAHKHVLGVGPELVEIDAENYLTKKAKTERDEAYADGAVPLLPKEMQVVEEMAAAIRQHPYASILFDPAQGGKGEQSLFWRDRQTGIMRRARLDWLPTGVTSRGRLLIPDYKTCAAGDLVSLQKAIHRHGYHQQADWYVDGVLELNLAEDAAFVFVFQEKKPPYVVTVVEVDRMAMTWGDALNRRAIDVYRRCTAAGRWPGYSDDVEQLSLPRYAELEYQAAQERGDFNVKGVHAA